MSQEPHKKTALADLLGSMIPTSEPEAESPEAEEEAEDIEEPVPIPPKKPTEIKKKTKEPKLEATLSPPIIVSADPQIVSHLQEVRSQVVTLSEKVSLLVEAQKSEHSESVKYLLSEIPKVQVKTEQVSELEKLLIDYFEKQTKVLEQIQTSLSKPTQSSPSFSDIEVKKKIFGGFISRFNETGKEQPYTPKEITDRIRSSEFFPTYPYIHALMNSLLHEKSIKSVGHGRFLPTKAGLAKYGDSIESSSLLPSESEI
jgi:hypothetical protein